MIRIELNSELAEKLNTEAERRNTTLETLVNEWLTRELWELNKDKIKEESERYRAVHAQLREQYADKIIALRDGQVVDVGDEMIDVYRRVRERFGDEPVLITRVGNEPIETFKIRRPRLITSVQ